MLSNLVASSLVLIYVLDKFYDLYCTKSLISYFALHD